MNIDTDKEKMIFRTDKDGKTFYQIGLSRKNQDGTYTNGYIGCKFPKTTTLENKTKIKIHEAWLDFYLKEKITVPYIFISKYEIVQDNKQETIQDIPNVKTDYQDTIVIQDEDLPF